MDAKNLEKIRFTALKHVQRCTPTCPLSTSCRFRHGRGKLRYGEPCTQEALQFKRFVVEVTHDTDGAAFDLMQAAMDAALIDLLIDRCSRRLADWRALVDEATEAEQPGPDGRRSRSSVAKTEFRPEVGVLMRLMRRKNKLIDRCRALRQAATDASSPDHLSGTATPKRGCVNACAAGTSAYAASRLERRIYMMCVAQPRQSVAVYMAAAPPLPGQSRFIRPKPEPENGHEKGDS